MNIDLKTYFKVMSILMLIYAILLCITVFGVVFGVLMFVGYASMKKAENATNAELIANGTSSFVWGIIFGVFTLPVGALAIVFSCLAMDKLNKMRSEMTGDNGNGQNQGTEEKIDPTAQLRKDLEELLKMRNEGLITEEEYQQQRQKLLKKFG